MYGPDAKADRRGEGQTSGGRWEKNNGGETGAGGAGGGGGCRCPSRARRSGDGVSQKLFL